MAPLNSTQTLALLSETAAIRYLLDSGDRLLRAGVPLERERDAVLASLSIGVEKLAKVALCLIEIAEGRPWPAVQVLGNSRADWGHKSAAMDARLREALSQRITGLEHEGLLRRMLCTVERDEVWKRLVETFEAYGAMGRFFHLDALAGSPQPATRDPQRIWDLAENAAVAATPELQAIDRMNDFDRFERALLAKLGDSVRRWWSLVALTGMHGALGSDGRVFGADVLPDGAVPFQFDPACP